MSGIPPVSTPWAQRAYEQLSDASRGEGAAPSGFAERLGELLGSVDSLQDRSAELQTAAIQGEEVAAHDIMIASEQAGLAFTLMVEIRNKLVEAYQELMRMQA